MRTTGIIVIILGVVIGFLYLVLIYTMMADSLDEAFYLDLSTNEGIYRDLAGVLILLIDNSLSATGISLFGIHLIRTASQREEEARAKAKAQQEWEKR